MEFRGIYLAYYSGNPTNNEQNPTIASMPTFTIGAGTVLQSNATNFNTTYQNFRAFTPYSYNLTEGRYTYAIPDSFNSNYVTIYYNPAWTIELASYGYSSGKEWFSNGSYMPYITFSGITGIGTLTMTFIEPLVIGQPLGTMSLGVLPSVAVGGKGFFELPSDLLHWEANGVPVNPSGFSVVVGKVITIQAFSGSNTMVYNSTFTPTQQVTFLQTYVNVTEFQFNNLNSTDEVQVTATSNGATQSIALLAPYGTGAASQTVYLPSGNYTFKYVQLNYTTGSVAAGTSTEIAPLTSYNGMYWVTLNGFTVFQLGNQLKGTNSSIAKSFQTLQVIISLNDSTIKNLTLGVDLNLSLTNTSIQSVMTNILVNESTIHSVVNSTHNNLVLESNYINTTMKYISNNVTVLQNYEKTYINATVNNIKAQDVFINDTVNTVDTNVTLLQTYTKTYLNATENNIKLQENFINTTLNTVDTNINTFSNYVHSTVETSITNVSLMDKFINATLLKVQNNVSLDQTFINSSVHQVGNNLTLFQNYVKTTINSTINNIKAIQVITNSTVHYISNNVTLLQAYTKDYINATINNIKLQENFINTTLHSFNLNFTSKINILNTSINSMNLNQSSYFNIVHSIVGNINFNATQRYKMEEVAGTFAYHFVPKSESLLSNGVDITAWLENVAGQPVNSTTLVKSVWDNLTVQYMNMTDRYAIKPVLLSYNSYSVTFFLPLNKTQVQSIQNGGGNAEISMFAPFISGSASNVAVGVVNPSNANLENVTGVWKTLGFASDPPYAVGTIQALTWFLGQASGRAIVEGIVLLAAIVELLFYIGSWKNAKTKGYFKAIYDKIGSDDDE